MLRRLSDGAVIDVDDDALDENGLLRDGHRMRVPMEFRDSASPDISHYTFMIERI